jgi:large conductance mechanosensitive channel
MIKALNKLSRKKEEAPTEPPQPSDEVKLLTEIRDTLRKNNP